MALTAFAVQRALAGRGFETTTGKPARWRRPSWAPGACPLLLFALVALAAVVAPLASMLAAALTRNLSGGLSLANLTLANFALFQARGEAWDALSTSLSLAAGAALLAGAVGLAAVRGRPPRARRPAIDGLALLRRCPAWWWSGPDPGLEPALLAGHALRHLGHPAAVLYLPAALSRALRRRGAGADRPQPGSGGARARRQRALRRIVLPLVLPALAASMLMVFAVASRELVTSRCWRRPACRRCRSMWRQFEQGSVGEGMAMATVAVAASLTLMLGASAIRRRGED